MKIKDYITQNEGLKLFLYKDIFGKITIGIGRNLSGKGITIEEANFLLENDIKECIFDLKEFIFADWYNITTSRQIALIDMRFQLGYGGFRGFKKMIKAVNDKDWIEAAKQIKESNYYKQTTARAERNIKLMEEG